MRKKSQILIALLLLLFMIPLGLPNQVVEETELKMEEAPIIEEHSPLVLESDVGSVVTLQLTYESPFGIIAFSIEESGLYIMNWTYSVDWAPDDEVNIYATYLYSSDHYVPQIDDFTRTRQSAGSKNVYGLGTDDSGSYHKELTCFGSGYFAVAFDSYMYSNSSATVNVTVIEIDNYDQFALMTLGSNTEAIVEENYATNGTRISLQENLYFIEIDFLVPYETTESWSGGIVYPLSAYILSMTHGPYALLMDYSPSLYLDPGASTGAVTFHKELHMALPEDTYYFLLKSQDIDFFNCTQITMTANVTAIQTTPLTADSPVDVTVDEEDEYVEWYSFNPEFGTKYNISMDYISGANWSLFLLDVLTGSPAAYFSLRSNDTSMIYEAVKTEKSGQIWMPAGYTMEPAPSLIGNPYLNLNRLGGSLVLYENGTLADANIVGDIAVSLTSSFYFRLEAVKIDTTTSPSFNVTIMVEAETTTELAEGMSVLNYNMTFGPAVQFLTLDVSAGTVYEITANATEYTNHGGVSIMILSQPDPYRQWGFISNPLLAVSSSASIFPAIAYASNESASIRWMSVREETLLVIIHGFAFTGSPSVSDTTEVTVILESTPAESYSLGSEKSLYLANSFAAYTFNVVEGYSYELEMSIDYESNVAHATFVNSLGQTPFDITAQHVWSKVGGPISSGIIVMSSETSTIADFPFFEQPEGLEFKGSFVAKETGEVCIILAGYGNVEFSVRVVDNVLPVVAFTNISNGEALDVGAIVLEFSASDDIGVVSLSLDINGTSYSLSPTATSYEWTPDAEGIYVLTLTATDAAGNSASATLVVLIGNDPDSFGAGRDQGLDEGLNQGLVITAIGAGGAIIVGLIIGNLIGKRRA